MLAVFARRRSEQIDWLGQRKAQCKPSLTNCGALRAPRQRRPAPIRPPPQTLRRSREPHARAFDWPRLDPAAHGLLRRPYAAYESDARGFECGNHCVYPVIGLNSPGRSEEINDHLQLTPSDRTIARVGLVKQSFPTRWKSASARYQPPKGHPRAKCRSSRCDIPKLPHLP
jgi:hypothetical protein